MISWKDALDNARHIARQEENPHSPPGLLRRADVLERIETDFPYCIEVSTDHFYTIAARRGVNLYTWCEEHFGPEAIESHETHHDLDYYVYNATRRWTRNDLFFCFRDETDAILYKVMWG